MKTLCSFCEEFFPEEEIALLHVRKNEREWVCFDCGKRDDPNDTEEQDNRQRIRDLKGE